MCKRLTPYIGAIALIPSIAFSQIIDQQVISSHPGEKRITRHVVIKDEHGLDTVVEQNLTELPNGDLLYIHDAQPQPTRDLDARLCEAMGENATVVATLILGPDTLSSVACHMPAPDGDLASKQTGARAPTIQARAPGPYAVPVNQNSVHRGQVNYRSEGPATITGEVVVDERCRTALSDYVSHPVSGQTAASVNCYMPRTGSAPTRTSACVGGTCAADRNTITVF
ncbi:hypothetical protein L2Y96_14620 [Luteibacter aegosomaticola]|uniref:hypothetical protein n=1 Tax=Luteibacter aegosomaticola TaxID=2911538 RepID=UPI001FF7F604|nr:hypothetical protein [Luteibacter aegosomaticola]UPG88647.1 hypothetical protein L2Y96_14620 [Luteibacter aegosomaticola]